MPDTRYSSLDDLGQAGESPYERGLRRINEQIDTLRSNIGSVSQTTRTTSAQLQALIESLSGTMEKLGVEVGRVADNMSRYSSASARNRETIKQEAATMDDVWAAYRKMGVEVKNLELNLETLNFSEKEINKVVQFGTQYNRERSDSYTALSQKYRAVKILIDQMTVAERENTEAGRNLVAKAREWYEQMNLLQQRTGKYQLQVGDYSKAMTGLNIATNQVVRELPVLANGVSMFAIAISNNIPILVDNIVQVRRANIAQEALKKELLETAAAYELEGRAAEANAARQSAAGIKTTSVISALGKAVFSWQTAIVLVLTVLPNLIRNIQKNKKEMSGLNEETAYAVSLAKIYRDSLDEEADAIDNATGKISILFGIYNDETRTREDRIAAMNAIHRLFGDEIKDYGDAALSVEKYIEKLNNQAVAEEKMQRIMELNHQNRQNYSKLEEIYSTKAYQRAVATEAEARAAVETQRAYVEEQKYLKISPGKIQSAEAILKEKERAFERASQRVSNLTAKETELIKNNTVEVERLTKELTQDYLDALGNVRKGYGSSRDLSLPDYFWDALKASAEALESSLDRDLAVLEAAWIEEQNGYLDNINKLNEMRKTANAEERAEINEQTSYILSIINKRQKEYEEEQKRIIRERIDSYATEVEEEEDLDETRIKAIVRHQREEKILRDEAAYQAYEVTLRTAEDKENLDKALRESERLYWEGYLEDLRKNGLLTIQEYNNIMSNLAKSEKQNEDKARRGRRGRRYGGIVEAILAQTSLFGGKDEYDNDVVKKEYQDFVSAIDNALKTSMGFMDEWMDKRLEMAKIAVEAAEREVAAAQKVLDFEMEARANGYANRVETARKELDLERENHRKALEEQRRLQEQQLLLDSISQTSSLITATANIWESMTKGTGIFGPGLAIAATALLWGSFAASKIKAKQLAGLQAEQYGEGTVELLEGGSHASGHDIDLGVKKDGTRRRAEGGEFFAVINKRNSRRYRSIIPDVINSFNDGTFGDKYQRANEAMGNFALGVMAGNSPTDVSALERDVRAIREQGDEHRYVDMKGNTIIRYKNLTRKINRS